MFFEKDPFLKKWERNLAEKPKRIFSEKQKPLPLAPLAFQLFLFALGGNLCFFRTEKPKLPSFFPKEK